MKTEQIALQKRFGRLLRREREVDDLTQSAVSAQRKCHASLVGDYEQGERSMPIARVGEGGPHELRALAHFALERLPLSECVGVLCQVVESIAGSEGKREAKLVALEDVREAAASGIADVREEKPGLRSVRPLALAHKAV